MKITLLVILVVCLYFVWRVTQSKPKPNEDKRIEQATQDIINNIAQCQVDESMISVDTCDQLMLHLYALY